MKVGIVAEGPADVAVVMNILFGKLGVEQKDVLPIRPELTLDETDLAAKRKAGFRAQQPREYSNWQLVLEECAAPTQLLAFLDNPIDEERLLVIHLDTAEAEQGGFDVARPERRGPRYVEEMRGLVVAKLEGLLGEELARQSRFAVAVEETDAWLLTLHEGSDKDTGLTLDPKKKLARLLDAAKAPGPAKAKGRKARTDRRADGAPPRGGKWSAFEAYRESSRAFRDPPTLASSLRRNRSLAMFVVSLEGSGAASAT